MLIFMDFKNIKHLCIYCGKPFNHRPNRYAHQKKCPVRPKSSEFTSDTELIIENFQLVEKHLTDISYQTHNPIIPCGNSSIKESSELHIPCGNSSIKESSDLHIPCGNSSIKESSELRIPCGNSSIKESVDYHFDCFIIEPQSKLYFSPVIEQIRIFNPPFDIDPYNDLVSIMGYENAINFITICILQCNPLNIFKKIYAITASYPIVLRDYHYRYSNGTELIDTVDGHKIIRLIIDKIHMAMIKVNIDIINKRLNSNDINYLYDVYEIGKIQTNLIKLMKLNKKIKKEFDSLITVNEHPYLNCRNVTIEA